MPLQIKELHIKVTVNTDESGESEVGANQPGATSGASSSSAQGDIIAECVEQVLEILKEKMEP